MNRVDVMWAATTLTVLVAAWSWLPRPRASDSYDPGPDGKKAVYLLARALFADVSRSERSLVPAEADTLVMLGPDRYPDRAQWQSLHDWVARGHVLVFAARHDDPAVHLAPFGIEVVPYASADVAGVGDSGWRSVGEVVYASDDVSVVLSSEGSPQVVMRPVGSGAIVVAASDFIFTNRAFSESDNALMAHRILEKSAPAGPVLFDETLNTAGRASAMRLLLAGRLRGASAQALVVLVLAGWMLHRNAGPGAAAPPRARAGSIEHARALGRLHYVVDSSAPDTRG